MWSIRICNDLDECKHLWNRMMAGGQNLFLQWEIRACFQQTFDRTPCFIVCEDSNRLVGLLALSRIEETDSLAFFPGETWHQKTWLEQNRIIADSPNVFRRLLESVPGNAHLRYLEGECIPPFYTKASVDEVGYLFLPKQYAYDYATYLNEFPRKSLKHIQREPKRIYAQGVKFRYNACPDIEHLFRLNLAAFGQDSYFHDRRFFRGFERLIAELDRRGALRITTVLVGGIIAAVDIGAVWGNCYTLLAGGTHREFPGVAKLINFHHLEIACRERFDMVDFLCGDFGWKQRFHLVSRPLHQIKLVACDVAEESESFISTGMLTNA